MSVCVKCSCDVEPIERPFQSTGAKKGKHLGTLTLDGSPNWRVVGNRDALRRLQARQSALEFHRLIDPFLSELLAQWFTPRIQHIASKTSTESANSGKSDSSDFGAFAFEQFYTSGFHDS